jgi:hypothetical protein
MKTVNFDVPSLYGDHHVLEVRRILMAVPGIQDVYASSCFHVVEVTYDPDQVNDLQIAMKLDEAGYLGEWTLPKESDTASYHRENFQGFTRHTAVYETTRQVVSFAQKSNIPEKPLWTAWTCPGMGLIRNKMED